MVFRLRQAYVAVSQKCVFINLETICEHELELFLAVYVVMRYSSIVYSHFFCQFSVIFDNFGRLDVFESFLKNSKTVKNGDILKNVGLLIGRNIYIRLMKN